MIPSLRQPRSLEGQVLRFPTDPEAAPAAAAERRLRRPIVAGLAVIGVLVVGGFTWAAASAIDAGVVTNGVVRVEANRKTVKSLAGGRLESIAAREGRLVAAGDVLMTFDRTQAAALVEVLQNEYDSSLALRARHEAELTDRPAITFPDELLARRADPRVAGLINDQQVQFQQERNLLDGQTAVLNQQLQQMNTRVEGLQAQVTSLDEQKVLITEELTGLRSLYERGFAPKTRVLALERSSSQIGGQRGAQVAEISRTRETQGETRLQMAGLRQERRTRAAAGLQQVQVKLSDVTPRLRAAREALDQAVVRAPVDGYVLNLTQFTVGGVAGPGETLLEVVPADAPLLVEARVNPGDVEYLELGQRAQVQLMGHRARQAPKIDGEVVNISADQRADAITGEPYFAVNLRISPAEVAKLGEDLRLFPGRPVQVLIVTGRQSVMDYMISPLKESIDASLREG